MAKHRASRKNPPQYRSEPAYAKRAAAVTGAALAMTVVGTLAGTPSEAPSQAAAEGIYPHLNLPTAQSVTPLGVPIVKKATKEAPLTPRFEDRLRAAMNQGVADAELRVTRVDRASGSGGGPRVRSHTPPRSEVSSPSAVPTAGSGVAPGAREELGAADARRHAGVPAAEAGAGTARGTRKTPCPPTAPVPVRPPVTAKPEPTAEPTPTPVPEPEPIHTPEPEPTPEPKRVDVPADVEVAPVTTPVVEETPSVVEETPVVSDVESTVSDTLDTPKDGES